MITFETNLKENNMATIIRVTREFSFEMAHVLGNYDGPCRNIHGHSYKLFITLAGKPVTDKFNPKYGMVIDFAVMKNIVNGVIIDKFDHSIVLSSEFGKEKLEVLRSMFENVNIVDYQPTCENLIADFAERLKDKLPEGVKLFSLRLHETEKLYAEWFASDNC